MSRRPGVGLARRGGWRGIGGTSAVAPLILTSGGTFTRSTEGSYLTAAPTSGTPAFLSFAAVDARRTGYLGLLLEGSRANRCQYSRDMATAPWTASGTPSYNAANGPDATLVADRFTQASGTFGNYQGITLGAAVKHTASAWVKRMAAAGAGNARIGFYIGGVADGAVTAIGDSVYSRATAGLTPGGAGAGGLYVPFDGRAFTSGPAAAAIDYLADMHQVEEGAFATSAIRTTGATVTRGADILSYAVGQYSASLLTSGGRVRIAPICSSADFVTGAADMVIAAVSTTDYVALYVTGGLAYVRLVQGGAQKVLSGAITWSADQVLTVTWRPTTGSVTVAGAATGDGTTAGTTGTWSSGTLYVGSLSDGGKPTFAHFTDSEIVAL